MEGVCPSRAIPYLKHPQGLAEKDDHLNAVFVERPVTQRELAQTSKRVVRAVSGASNNDLINLDISKFICMYCNLHPVFKYFFKYFYSLSEYLPRSFELTFIFS